MRDVNWAAEIILKKQAEVGEVYYGDVLWYVSTYPRGIIARIGMMRKGS